MGLQLYMWSRTREQILERHHFFLTQVKAKVLSQFQNIESEAERFVDGEYERLSSLTRYMDIDPAEIGELANDRGQVFYGQLYNLKKQMMLGALAGMYHQWEKDLRSFLERELNCGLKPKDAEKIWVSSIADVFKVLKDFGWDCRTKSFFSELDACRLIVNVFKHGNGPSLKDLADVYPNHINAPSAALVAANLDNEIYFLTFYRLAVPDSKFEMVGAAIYDFWEQFPERLYLNNT